MDIVETLLALADICEAASKPPPQGYEERCKSRQVKSDAIIDRLKDKVATAMISGGNIEDVLEDAEYNSLIDSYNMNMMTGIYETNRRIVILLERLVGSAKPMPEPMPSEVYTDEQKAQFDEKPYNWESEIKQAFSDGLYKGPSANDHDGHTISIPGSVLDESPDQYEAPTSPEAEDVHTEEANKEQVNK